MPFNSLSPELLDHIIFHLAYVPPSRIRCHWDQPPPSQGLSRYATISKKWQMAIEQYTFSAVKTDSSNFPKLKQIIGTCPRRKCILKELFYRIDLPPYSENQKHCFERHREHKANLFAFRKGLKDLWEELSLWSNGENASLGLRLVLTVDAPVKGVGDDGWACPEHSLTLDDSEESADSADSVLPNFPCIISLHLARTGRRIHPTTIGILLLSLPNIRNLDMKMHPVQRKHKTLVVKYRNALAKALESPTLHNLETADMDGRIYAYAS